jgi:hypothetical protein
MRYQNDLRLLVKYAYIMQRDYNRRNDWLWERRGERWMALSRV